MQFLLFQKNKIQLQENLMAPLKQLEIDEAIGIAIICHVI
jgi:hypothetical protein